jgi:hypothetical protein
MSGTSPNFKDWRKLTAIEIEDIACLMQGFDPRALADVVVRDPDDPASPYGVSPDTSWEVRMLISAVLTHDLTSAPTNITAPTGTTKVVRTSLIPWLRTFGEYGFLADGLSSPTSTLADAKLATTSRPAKNSQGLASNPTRPQPGTPTLFMTRFAMIQQHQREWPTIDADIRGACDNGLNVAKAGARGWFEAEAVAWARSKGKLIVPPNSTPLAVSMNSIVGRKHMLDG